MLSSLETDILKTVAYYDLFQYPLSEEEIYFFLERSVPRQHLVNELSQLCREGRLFHFGRFYSLRNDAAIKERRIKGNVLAARLLKRAHRFCRFLFCFPFVRGVAISGSLSKNFADKTSDIDYFIITSANKLWIARTLLHFFKKLTFLVGWQHRFCMNYFIDEDCLEIEEKNIFTAVEMVTLMPVCGNGNMEAFFETNRWSRARFPNLPPQRTVFPAKKVQPWFKRSFESLFNNKLGERMDNYLMNLTTRRWNDKEKKQKLNMKGGRMGLKTGKHYAKPNPFFFQQKILSLYATKLLEIEKESSQIQKYELELFLNQSQWSVNSRTLPTGSFPPHFTPREPGL